MMREDTIVAIATPPGRSGIGVVRLAGERAIEIATRLIHLKQPGIKTQSASVGTFTDSESGRALDEVILTCFRKPHSYTGDDVAEISCHGAPVILGYLVEQCLRQGARVAEPGEFTLRAFLNGKMDLTQAEAVRDLIESRTLYQARVAAGQLEGAVAARLKPHKQALVELIAQLEAGIDFVDDDVPVMTWEVIRERIGAVRCELEKLAAGFTLGRIVREGLSLAIVGRPNVGKSSLFNRLLNENRAIVTATPGTTRDLVAESTNIGGIPLRFVDTAGIRATLEEAEKIGVEKSLQSMADADVRLLVLESSQVWAAEDTDLLHRALSAGATLIVLNKSDLPCVTSSAEVEAEIQKGQACIPGSVAIIRTSALTGKGMAELKQKIIEVAGSGDALGSEGELITNLRHQQLLHDSIKALNRAGQAARNRVHHEMLLLDLYEALHAFDLVTGTTDVENILGIIFSRFCIGK